MTRTSNAPPDPYTGVLESTAASRKAFSWYSSRFAVIVVWALFVVLYGVLVPDTFLTVGAARTIFGSQQALVFLTAALMCTIIVGEFVDMSVASNFGLAATLVTVLTVNDGVNVWAAAVIAVIASVIVGIVNGFLIVRLGVNTIVVTLGMGTLLLGIALWQADLMPVSGLPASFAMIANFEIAGLPVSFFLGLILMFGFAYVLRFTPLGRNMRFVGENREVSRLAGVRVTRMRFGAFVVAGLIAGLGGVISAADTGGFDPASSQAFLLPMFAATFLGTAVLVPGRFNPIGTLIAIYFLATGVLGLQLLGGTSWVSDVFYGAVLVIAVTISTVLNKKAR